MPEVMFAGPDGRLEGRYHHAKESGAPVALVLHPHPLHGGTMNNRITYTMYQSFMKMGCSVMRFNFRGVGRSQGNFDHGSGELSDAAAALDWAGFFPFSPEDGTAAVGLDEVKHLACRVLLRVAEAADAFVDVPHEEPLARQTRVGTDACPVLDQVVLLGPPGGGGDLHHALDVMDGCGFVAPQLHRSGDALFGQGILLGRRR